MSRVDFPELERTVLEYWKKIDAFKQSLKLSEGRPEFFFYDGPPFATGLPHYGHLLAGIIKDVVTRYWHMCGYHVTRRFGWDCHGVPIEFEVEKIYGIGKPAEGGEGGVTLAEYNQKCRDIVMKYNKEWRATTEKMGRWIDFDNDYKTMNPTFMESVWWAFKQLYDKGLVYQGVKVMPFSTALHTPLSNFEAQQNYKDVTEPSITIMFNLLPKANQPAKIAGRSQLSAVFENTRQVCIIAWTTTPWTLPSNLALCVNSDFEYIMVDGLITDNKKPKGPKIDTGKSFILSVERLGEYFTEAEIAAFMQKKEEAEKAGKPISFHGRDLVGLKYEPLFPYFAEKAKETCFRVVDGAFVEEGSGTGIVHIAPFFGEDDYNVCIAHKVINAKGEPRVCPVDESGLYTKEVTDYAGKYVKDCDTPITISLKKRGMFVKSIMYTHSYPFCYRSDTPLLYKAVPSWFVNVEEIKKKDFADYLHTHTTEEYQAKKKEKREKRAAEAKASSSSSSENPDDFNRLIEANEDILWVPEKIKARFVEWLKNARDWAISRNRYWGTPIPIWESDDHEERIAVGSIAELEELTGVKPITDIHRDKIDNLTIPSRQGKGHLHRIKEIFDCWFESGSMPYAQNHYPFENKEYFEKSFPAEFIAEGLDQTRGWFYVLLVLSTALFGMSPFRNVIVNGIVLAADGQKMSKRLHNYPDPLSVIDKFGADSLRLCLISSPAVHAEELMFKEEAVNEISRQVMVPWYNSFKFFQQYVALFNQMVTTPISPTETVPVTVQAPFQHNAKLAYSSTNTMDKWIIASTLELLKFIQQEMKKYCLHTVVPQTLKFIDNLTNWYLRLNRRRLKGMEGEGEWYVSLCVLFEVLKTLCIVMAPFTPFITETMYTDLKTYLPEEARVDSVHFNLYPTVGDNNVKEAATTTTSSSSSSSSDTAHMHISDDQEHIVKAFEHIQSVIVVGRQMREKAHVSTKIPLLQLTVYSYDASAREDIDSLSVYIKDELNVEECVTKNPAGLIQLKCEPSNLLWRKANILAQKANEGEGKEKKGNSKAIVNTYTTAIKNLTKEDIEAIETNGSVTKDNLVIEKDDVVITRDLPTQQGCSQMHTEDGMIVELQTEVTKEALDRGNARNFVNRIMKMRKRLGLVPEDKVEIFVEPKGAVLPPLVHAPENVTGICGYDPETFHYISVEKKEETPAPTPSPASSDSAAATTPSPSPESEGKDDKSNKKGKEKGKGKGKAPKEGKKGGNNKQAEGKGDKGKKPDAKAQKGVVLPSAPTPEQHEQARKKLVTLIDSQYEIIKSSLRQPVFPLSMLPPNRVIIGRSVEEVDGCTYELVLTKPGLDFIPYHQAEGIKEDPVKPETAQLDDALAVFASVNVGYAKANELVRASPNTPPTIEVRFSLTGKEDDAKTYNLVYKKHWFLSSEEKWLATGANTKMQWM